MRDSAICDDCGDAMETGYDDFNCSCGATICENCYYEKHYAHNESPQKVFGPPADPEIVKGFTLALISCFENYVNNFDGNVDYIDGLMAVHNFHVRIVEHLVEESSNGIWRSIALDTFKQRMADPGNYDTKSK